MLGCNPATLIPCYPATLQQVPMVSGQQGLGAFEAFGEPPPAPDQADRTVADRMKAGLVILQPFSANARI
jgi:hypothetical protein